MKLLIDPEDLNDHVLNNPETTLTKQKIDIVTARNAWVFFSPTDLLCKYLKEDMSYEGLTQYEDKTHVWKDFLRKTLIREDYKIAGNKCRFVFTNKNAEDTLFVGDQIQIAQDFQQFYLQALKNRLLKVAAIDISHFSWKTIGKMIVQRCKEAEKVKNLSDICRLLFTLSSYKDLTLPNGIPTAKEIVAAYEKKIDELTNRYLIEWKKDEDFFDLLQDCEEDILDTDDTTVTVVDVDEEDTIDKSDDIYIELQKDIKRLIRRIASSKDDASLIIEPVYEDLYSLLKERINRDDIKEISDIAFFNKEIYPCISNAEVFLLNVDFFCNTYLAFRKERFEMQDANWNLDILGRIVGTVSKNYIHHDECSLLIGTINSILNRVARISEERFESFNGRFATAYKKNRKAVIGVDEATDYSLIDYYAINSLRHHVVSAVTLCGDMMQSMNEYGIKDWKTLQHPLLFENVDVRHLRMSYRQGPKLIKLAHYLYNKATGKRAPYSCYLKDEKKTPDPLWHESDDMKEKAEWMAKRVLEVFDAYKKVPSIAIFVNNTKEAQELHNALKEQEILENAGIDVINCTANDELTAPDSIRIFLLDRVKGMEFEVVFFYNIDEVAKAKLINQYLYVGLSRATFYMAVASNKIEDSQLKELSERFSKQKRWRNKKRHTIENVVQPAIDEQEKPTIEPDTADGVTYEESSIPELERYHILNEKLTSVSDTMKRTYKALAAGQTPEEIAKEQGMPPSTIYDHIAAFIQFGNLLVSDFVSSPVIDEVKKAIEVAESDKLSDIKALCSDSVAFDEIKMVLADKYRMEDLEENTEDMEEESKDADEGNEDDDVESPQDDDTEWHFVDSVPFNKSSKWFLEHESRVVLSPLGYYLEVGDEFIKLGDIPEGFGPDEGSIWIKRAKDERGARIVHDTDDDMYLIGYIREDDDRIVFTNPDNQEFLINF